MSTYPPQSSETCLEQHGSTARTNLQLHAILSGHLEGTSVEQIAEYLAPRKDQLRNVSQPFGKPSDASRRKIESGSISLPDGVILRVEDANKEFVFGISKRFEIDEVHSLLLLRSFMYNEGVPSSVEAAPLVEDLLEAITPFYYSERLAVLRVLIPLFRALENSADPIHHISTDFLPKLLPDGQHFTESLITDYVRKTKEKFPESMGGDPRAASRWAKQNAKEQLVLLEVLFWTMWGYVPCSGALVERILETAYSTSLGSLQSNATLLLDEEGVQLQQDCAALWILISVEILELENLGEDELVEISDNPSRKDIYTASPDSLKRIHEMVTSHEDSQYACLYLAWAYVLSRMSSKATQIEVIPSTYRPFFESLLPHLSRAYSTDREPTHVLMSRACLEPDVGLFSLLLNLLTQSPLFVTAVAWKTGSTVTDPNAIAFRSVLKGQ